ncbi:unnamed protein product [Taenia asiatica]|uniref:Secreted protein n=1 Tax=Taenia asiatica TaxID=60517 RepID=A0A0R3VTK0_TAEAS|nr:unnamed protein product [Taenia asiatica]|eukprot:TsM_000219600 transcript=TsM_000219600 gene=TsM_000219600
MQALVLTLGLLMTHLATTSAVAVAVPPALRSPVSVEDSNAALPVLEPLEPMDTELYYLRQLQDMRNRINAHRTSKRFFCNPYGCI